MVHSIKTLTGLNSSYFITADQQLRRSILGILWRLFLSDLAEVPDVEPPVGAAGGQDGFVVRRPLNLLGRDGPCYISTRKCFINIKQKTTAA